MGDAVMEPDDRVAPELIQVAGRRCGRDMRAIHLGARDAAALFTNAGTMGA